MLLRRVAGIEVDACASCKTAWFDEGELDTVLRHRTGAGVDTLGPSKAPEQEGGRCPLCPRTTETFRFHAAPDARVRACAGHGEWVEQDDGRTMLRWASREAAKVTASFAGRYARRFARRLEAVAGLAPLTFVAAWWITRDALAAAGIALLAAALRSWIVQTWIGGGARAWTR